MNDRSLLSTVTASGLALLLVSVLSIAASGCGASTPPPDDATSQNEASPDNEGNESSRGSSEPAEPEPKPLSHGAKKTTDDGSADDYTLTQKDCIELGKQYTAVQRADQVAGLNPKLTDKQREQVLKNIDDVVGKMGETWADGCITSLVGKVAERKRLACAMVAKTVKAFDDCLNAEAPPP